jgi:hypothetical protein
MKVIGSREVNILKFSNRGFTASLFFIILSFHSYNT